MSGLTNLKAISEEILENVEDKLLSVYYNELFCIMDFWHNCNELIASKFYKEKVIENLVEVANNFIEVDNWILIENGLEYTCTFHHCYGDIYYLHRELL